MKKTLLMVIIFTIFITAACSSDKANVIKKTEWYEITSVPKESLVSGMYYVKTKNELDEEVFYPTHLGSINYTSSITKVIDPNRIIKYTKNTEKIPKLYHEDELVYVSAINPPGIVVWERFKDRGYSSGISKIFINDTGRAQFTKDPINTLSYSDIGSKIAAIEDNIEFVLEKVNNVYLDSSQLSDIGTILNLEKDKLYPFEFYIGTNYYNIDVMADTNYFQSWEIYASNQFDYTKEGYAIITIPEGLSPGYYNINGTGLVCYMGNTPKSDIPEDIDLSQPGSKDNAFMLLTDALTSIGEDISDHEDMFVEDDFYKNEEKMYTEDDTEYEDFSFNIEVDTVNHLISPYWYSIPLTAQSYGLYISQDDEENYYYDSFKEVNEYEDTEGKDTVIYDANAKKIKVKFEIKKQDGTYYLEERTVNLTNPPNIVFPEGEVTYNPELYIKYNNFKGQMTSVFLNDVEVAITGFDGSGEHIVDLNPEWNHIKLKTHSPSVIWIWEKDIYYSKYKAIE